MRTTGSGILELAAGVAMIMSGFAVSHWASTITWITVYPPPLEKQLLDLLPLLLWVSGIALIIDAGRHLLAGPHTSMEDSTASEAEHPQSQLSSATEAGWSSCLKVSGYLVPLVQQVPALGAYVGLMTLPLFVYAVALFSNFPSGVITRLGDISVWSFSTLDGLVSTFGFLLAILSAFYLRLHRQKGLIATGPYRCVRHPQYAGFLLWTVGLTGWSYWILTNTFGVGWLSPEQTIGLWYAELFTYLGLALLEESYLHRRFSKDFETYKCSVPFFIPTGKASRLDIPVTIMSLSAVLFIVVNL